MEGTADKPLTGLAKGQRTTALTPRGTQAPCARRGHAAPPTPPPAASLSPRPSPLRGWQTSTRVWTARPGSREPAARVPDTAAVPVTSSCAPPVTRTLRADRKGAPPRPTRRQHCRAARKRAPGKAWQMATHSAGGFLRPTLGLLPLTLHSELSLLRGLLLDAAPHLFLCERQPQ